MNKILSVSVASYNVEKYLDKLFETLTISDYVRDNIEFIVVNDGSKDKTMTIAQAYKDKYKNSIVIIDKKNGGYGSTINASIKVATGKYYKILDGDDWFDNNNIEDFLKYLDKAKEDLIISPYTLYYENSDKIEIIDKHNKKDLNENSIVMHEITIKTELYREKGTKITEHCFYTDTEYALSAMLISSTIAKYPKSIYCYRLGREGQSVSKEGYIKHIDDLGKVVHKCIDLYSISTDKKAFNKFYGSLLNSYYFSLVLAFGINGVDRIIEMDNFIKNNYLVIYKMTNIVKRINLIRLINYKPKILVKYLFTEKDNNS